MCAEKDRERTQRHHDELVIAINAGKEELREKRKERGAAADANRKAGYSMHTSCATALASHFQIIPQALTRTPTTLKVEHPACYSIYSDADKCHAQQPVLWQCE